MRADELARRRRRELHVLVVLTLLLAPALAVATVGGYGLSIWLYQIFTGPPKAPRAAPIAPPGPLVNPTSHLEKP
jgi:nitrate reductase NapE